MDTKFLIVLTSLLLIALGLQIVKRKVKTWEARLDFLSSRWQSARQRRLRYVEDHPFFNFRDTEYQRLFEIEIGAEDLYLLHRSRFAKGVNISWRDYCHEQREECED